MLGKVSQQTPWTALLPITEHHYALLHTYFVEWATGHGCDGLIVASKSDRSVANDPEGQKLWRSEIMELRNVGCGVVGGL